MRIFDGITPETESTMHYFWSAAHCFDVGNPATTDLVYGQIDTTFQEDRQILEWQQSRMDAQGPRWIDIRGDVAGIQVRRMVRERLAEEAGASQALAA